MSTTRAIHEAVLLNSGQILVAGGVGGTTVGTNFPTVTELYDPATGRWTRTGSLNIGREAFTLTLLSDGRVLAAGGQNKANRLVQAEIYDPATGTWSVTGSLALGRSNHTATLLPNGQVLVAGGFDGRRATASAELYDPRPESGRLPPACLRGRHLDNGKNKGITFGSLRDTLQRQHYSARGRSPRAASVLRDRLA